MYPTEQFALMDAMYAAGNLTAEEYRGATAVVVGETIAQANQSGIDLAILVGGTIVQVNQSGIDFAISGDFIARNRAMVEKK